MGRSPLLKLYSPPASEAYKQFGNHCFSTKQICLWANSARELAAAWKLPKLGIGLQLVEVCRLTPGPLMGLMIGLQLVEDTRLQEDLTAPTNLQSGVLIEGPPSRMRYGLGRREGVRSPVCGLAAARAFVPDSHGGGLRVQHRRQRAERRPFAD